MEAHRRRPRIRRFGPQFIAVLAASLLGALCATGGAAAATGGAPATKAHKAAAKAVRKASSKKHVAARKKRIRKRKARSRDRQLSAPESVTMAGPSQSGTDAPKAKTSKPPAIAPKPLATPTTPTTPSTSTAPPTATSTTPATPASPSVPSAPTASFSASSLGQFWLQQSARGAITEVPDPAGGDQAVFKLTVNDNDGYPVTPTSDPRAELLSPSTIKAGDEFWWSTKFFLPEEFPSVVPGWMNLLQVFGSPADGSPPFHIEVNGSNIQWTRNQTYGWDIPWRMPLVKNAWVTVMVHERFASDGFVEMWINGQQVTFFGSGGYNPKRIAPTQRLEMQTMDASNSGANNSVFIQSYRKKGMFPTVTSYAGPLTIGGTRESVGG